MTNEELDNAKPIAELIAAVRRAKEAHEDIDKALDAVIERDIDRGLYKLTAGPRKERVLLLANEGLSNRQIAKVLGVGSRTVDRDIAAPNGAPDAPFGAAKSKSKDNGQFSQEQVQELIEKATIAERKRTQEEYYSELNDQSQNLRDLQDKIKILEEEKRKHNQELQDIEEKYKGIIIDAKKEPEPGMNFEFEKQIDKLVMRVHDFKNNELWESQIKELETYKNDICLNGELLDLERLISALFNLEKEILKWRKRITPSSDEWKNRKRSLHPNSENLT
jgi:transposase